MSEKVEALRRTTGLFLVVIFSVGSIWDVYVAYNDVAGDTISELLRDLSARWWSIPFVFGIVVGHLFWNQPAEQRKPRAERMKIFFGLLVPLVAAVAVRDALNAVYSLPTFGYANLLMLVSGIVAGALLWPQAMFDEEEKDHDGVHEGTDQGNGPEGGGPDR